MSVKTSSGWRISKRLIGQVKPLMGIMVLAVMAGVLGHLAAVAIPVFGAASVAHVVMGDEISFFLVAAFLLFLGIARAFLHYGEQLANHYIAFKILAIIRDRVFRALRRLAPARLEGRDSGTLISVVTADIELLEVFYAHTISPVAIAIVYTAIMMGFFLHWHWSYALFALFIYLILAIAVPILTSHLGRDAGRQQRSDLSRLNGIILDSFRGIRECIQFDCGTDRLNEMNEATEKLRHSGRQLSRTMGQNAAISLAVVLLSYLGFLLLAAYLFQHAYVDWLGVLIPAIGFMSSFGPLLALSSLANNLLLTFACGERVLGLLDEEPTVLDVVGEKQESEKFDELSCSKVYFSYQDKQILDGWSLAAKKGEVLGISGPSGCGKSTVLKLMMRFYDPDSGEVSLNDVDLRRVPTAELRALESYMTQSTHLFDDNLRENVRLARLDASDKEVEEACRKASIHDTILAFPDGYETEAGALGDRLSAGERQRIGLARAFLHAGEITLLDEPTANIDSLNEGIILKAIAEEAKEQAVVLVTHRSSTLRIADRVLYIESTDPS